MTIPMDEAVYEGLVSVVGDGLPAGYDVMAQDTAREQDALEWSEALIGDPVQRRLRMRPHPVLQSIIDTSLPATSGRLEFSDHIGI